MRHAVDSVWEIIVCSYNLITDTHGFVRRAFCLRTCAEGPNSEVLVYFPNWSSTIWNKGCVLSFRQNLGIHALNTHHRNVTDDRDEWKIRRGQYSFRCVSQHRAIVLTPTRSSPWVTPALKQGSQSRTLLCCALNRLLTFGYWKPNTYLLIFLYTHSLWAKMSYLENAAVSFIGLPRASFWKMFPSSFKSTVNQVSS